MSRAMVAAALLAAAAALHLGYTEPTRRALRVLADDHARAATKKREVSERRERAERRHAEYVRVTSVLIAAARGTGDPVVDLRRDVLAVLKEAQVAGVRVSVGPGRDDVGATVMVSGRGRIEDVSRLSGALVQGAPALVLDQVRLSALAAEVAFEISGARLQGPR